MSITGYTQAFLLNNSFEYVEKAIANLHLWKCDRFLLKLRFCRWVECVRVRVGSGIKAFPTVVGDRFSDEDLGYRATKAAILGVANCTAV